MTTEVYCGGCDSKLETADEPCPNCGSHKRKYSVALEETVGLTPSMRASQRDSTGFEKKKVVSRRKRGGKTGRPAVEEQVYDRTSDEETRKTHKVWEMNEEGQWEKVHDEEERSAAKHRRKAKWDLP